MTAHGETFIVVGAGHAGGRAVEALRNQGFAGRIVLTGAEPHLPYERPPLSKELMQDKPGYAFSFIRDRAFYDENEVELCLGVAATALDVSAKRLRLADGHELAWDRLLLTTGGRVRRLDLPGADLANIHTLRTVDDSRAITAGLTPGARAVIVGGGFIGLEVAASARRRGAEVTVLEAADRLMGRAVAPEVAALFVDLHRAAGVEVRLGAAVAGFEGTAAVKAVATGDGDHPADLAVVGIGIAPETELAAAAGLAVDNGVVVDEHCRTSAPDIFAAGDATNHFNPRYGRHMRLESWHNAQNQAIAAARAMCGDDAPYAEVPWFWSDQFDANLQMAGVPATWDETVSRGDQVQRNFISFQIAGGRVVGATAINRARDMTVARRLIARESPVTLAALADEDTPLRSLLG